MSYKTRLSTSIVLSVFLFAGAVLIWGYQTGKIVILGNQQVSTKIELFDSRDSLLKGQANDQIDLSDPAGVIKMMYNDLPSGGFYSLNKVGIYTSPVIGRSDLISFQKFTPLGESKPTGELSQSFVDVPKDNWAIQDIEALYRAGITTGCSQLPLNYCPDGYALKRQAVTVVLRALYFPNKLPQPKYPGSYYFADVEAGSQFDSEIGLGKELGIVGFTVSGFHGETLYGPDAEISRTEMAVFLAQALKLDTSSFDPNNQSTWAVNFSDVLPTYRGWKEIQACYKAGIIQGYPDGTFRPSAWVKRDAMAVFITKAFPVIKDLTTQFIIYQFAGSTDGSTWSSWQSLPTLSPDYDLSKLPAGSKFVKARIIFSALNADAAPSLNGFSVSYTVPGVTDENGSGNGDGGKSRDKITKLVSTGTNLWFNLLIALVLSAGISYLLLHKRSS